MMQDNEYLAHHGIKGQSWGKKNGPPYPLDDSVSTGKSLRKKPKKEGVLAAHFRKQREKKEARRAEEAVRKRQKSAYKTMTDEELRKAKDRLRLENEYIDEVTKHQQKTISRGRKLLAKVLENSGENILTQLSAYAMGTAINTMAGKNIVNPKKGQKGKD